MTSPLDGLLERTKKNGSLAIFANLLFDAVLLGWIIFAGLYALEVLLPTFVTARLSLVKFSVFLITLTALLARLRRSLPETDSEKTAPTRLIWMTGLFVVGTIIIAHYRFPWWSIPLSTGGYLIIAWLFLRNSEVK